MINFNTAIVRRPAKSVCKGLRAGDGDDPDINGVAAEHDAYVDALQAAGLAVTVLEPLEAFPDSIFVEDPALVFSNFAVLLRPGAPSRRDEPAKLAPALRAHFDQVVELDAGHADGGDILQTPQGVMIGLSARTDKAGAAALQKVLADRDVESAIVETPAGVLHFKSDCALLDEETVLSTLRLAASNLFSKFQTLLTPDGDEGAANALRINDVVFLGEEFPRTIDLVAGAGFNVVPLPTKEIAKIDAGLSCMSLRWLTP
ncbi:MAG: dimethylarginine dimethylaminohydrolase [Marinicaulis sp.]|nr:dimethylarginine dimethylaminohydrolase [Marinicaulis sp.]NNL88219.1 dimethylarginine dimethylaminohydrolase [Marinicaulis sp.]